MANKRILKKRINHICSELFSECIAKSLYSGRKNKESINAVLSAILIIHNKYICRVSHPEPGIPPKKYYKDLKDRFYVQICEITDNIANV